MNGLLLGLAAAIVAPTAASPQAHAFDFEIGAWQTELWRLKAPLSGSTEWRRYTGTTRVTPVWGGKGNLIELEADGPGGHLEALSLRLYDPASQQWTLNYSNAAYGRVLGPPSVGRFHDGIGEFYNQDTLDGRAILVRFLILDASPRSVRFEQSYSADGGRTWEANWIATDTRTGD